MVMTSVERNARHRERYANDPEYRARRIASCKAWDKRNPEKRVKLLRNGQKRRRYGLTEMDYELGIMACGGHCEICGITFQDAPHVDHVHGTKLVRGLLCSECNLGLGKFKDNPELLEKAALYLRVTS